MITDRTFNWAKGVSTDSRTVKKGQLFFALPGENFDGHDYVSQALQVGAAAAVISEPGKVSAASHSGVLIQVRDPLEALQKLAKCYRQQFTVPIVAVTGSVGKTTTKDILADCLAPLYCTLKTPGNYNNEIGLPLTLMSLSSEHQAAVVELAMRRPGEIAQLASIVQPTYGIITNILPVHLETLGSLENIARAKCELLEYIARDKFVLLDGDNELLLKEAQSYTNIKYTFGHNDRCDFQIKNIERAGAGINITLRLLDKSDVFYFPLPAQQWAGNIAAAVGCALLMGVSRDMIWDSLCNYVPSENRLHIIDLPAGGAVINDTYNANPVSMIAALEVSSSISQSRKTVAVLGDMLELGDYEKEGHLEVGRKAAALDLDRLVTIGERAAYIEQGALLGGMPAERVIHFPDREASLPWLKENVDQQAVIIFKASRAMGLEKLVQGWLD